MKSAVIVFPGSNCDRDAQTALKQVTGKDPAMVWHKDAGLPDGLDLIVLPGGFSYGDYLRSGAMAAASPIGDAIRAHAARGGYVLAICNGFQVATELGLLPGALLRNASLNFCCRPQALSIASNASAFTPAMATSAKWYFRSRTMTATSSLTMLRSTASKATAAWPSVMSAIRTARRAISRASCRTIGACSA